MLLGISPAALAAQETRVEVVDVRFDGRAALPLDVIEEAIATHASACRSLAVQPLCWLGVDRVIQRRYLDEAEARRDAERIRIMYEVWGYPRASVRTEIDATGDEATVRFLIEEGPPLLVESLRVEAPAGVALPADVPLRTGEPYALPLLEASLDRLRWKLAQQGHPYAQATVDGAVDENSLTATLVLTVLPGPLVHFGAIEIQAEAPLQEEVVRERLAFGAGERYSDIAMERTERALYRLPAIGRAVVVPSAAPIDSTVVPVVVNVAPRRLRGIEGEATLSTTDCVELGAFWTHRHFMGAPRVFSVGGVVSNLLAGPLDESFPCTDTGDGAYARVDYEARISISQPMPGLPRTEAFIEFFGERHSTPGVFVQTGFGGRARVSHAFDVDRTTAISLEYAPAHVELNAADLYFCVHYGVCRREAIDAVAGPARLAPLSLVATHRSDAAREGLTTDKLPLWRRGPPPPWRLRAAAGVEAVAGWTGSDFSYQRAFLEVAPTRRLGEQWDLGMRLRAAAIFGDGIVPPQSRLYVGGPASLRAIQHSQFGPANLVADPSALDALGCAPTPGGCPSGTAVDPDRVQLRPLGGRAIGEASFEARHWLGDLIQVAAFVDMAAIWRGAPWESEASEPHVLVAPGVGLRLIANIGAIRLDLAFDPRGAQELPLRSAIGPAGEIIELGTVTYERYTYDDPGPLREFMRRLQLQVAVGQPF